MPRLAKPTHGGSRKGAGRPPTTYSRSTPIVSFRLGAEYYRALVKAASRMDRTPNQVAKSALVNFLFQRPYDDG